MAFRDVEVVVGCGIEDGVGLVLFVGAGSLVLVTMMVGWLVISGSGVMVAGAVSSLPIMDKLWLADTYPANAVMTALPLNRPAV